MRQTIVGIDVHKRMLMVAVGTITTKENEEGESSQRIEFQTRRFGTNWGELQHLVAWLQARGAEEVV